MRRSLRYLDAVKVLAGGENQFIKLLDDASATMLLGAGVFDLFEAREQALRLLGKVLDKFGEKLRGVDRLTRTERIHAAHEIIRITAYFDALADALGVWKVRFSAAEQAALAAARDSDADLDWRGVYEALSESDLMPLIYDTSSVYQFSALSSRISVHICPPKVWDALSEAEQSRLSDLLSEVPADAAVRYQENLRRLSVDCPEFGVWVNLQAHAATREQLATSLAGLEALLAPLAARSADHQQESLTRARRADLAKPIILTEDLRALNIWRAERDQSTFRSTLSAGQQMVGRFFFVHDVQATRDGGELQTYEFLHATFSEYLTARLVVQLLADLARQYVASVSAVSRSVNDAMLYALLSFDCLAARAPIVEFTGELIAQHDPVLRAAMADILTKLFHRSLMERTDRTYSDYQPVVAALTTRASCWNANLFLLMTLTQSSVSLRALYPGKDDGAAHQWHRLTNMWRSCIRGAGWDGIADCLILDRTWLEGDRDIVIRTGLPVASAAKPDLTWTYHVSGAPWADNSRWDSHARGELSRRVNFLMDRRLDVTMHNTQSIGANLPTIGNTLFNIADGRLVTMTALLTTALMAPHSAEPADDAIIDLAQSLPRLTGRLHEVILYHQLAFGLFITAVEMGSLSIDARHKLRHMVVTGITQSGGPDFNRLRARLYGLLAQDLLSPDASAPTTPTPPAPAASPSPEPSPTASSPGTPARPPAVP